MSKEKEIRDAIEREKHPERKRTRAEIRSIEREIARIWRDGDEKDLMRFLRGIGLKDESPDFVRAVSVFRSLRAGKH